MSESIEQPTTRSEQRAAAPVIVARTPAMDRFAPHPAPTDSVRTVRRDLLTAERSGQPSELGRQRAVAGNLPGWEPLPPGEIVMRRSQG